MIFVWYSHGVNMISAWYQYPFVTDKYHGAKLEAVPEPLELTVPAPRDVCGYFAFIYNLI